MKTEIFLKVHQYEFKGWVITIHKETPFHPEFVGFAIPKKVADSVNVGNFMVIDEYYDSIHISQENESYNSLIGINIKSKKSVLYHICLEILQYYGLSNYIGNEKQFDETKIEGLKKIKQDAKTNQTTLTRIWTTHGDRRKDN